MGTLAGLLSKNIGMHYTIHVEGDLVHVGRLLEVHITPDRITITNMMGAIYHFVEVVECTSIDEQTVRIEHHGLPATIFEVRN